MRRLRVLILVFVLALVVPLGYLVFRTHHSLEQEETAELRFFANTLFDQLEQELAALVQREERRPVEEYLPASPPSGNALDEGPRSPLSRAAAEPYILGYLQNNPDGTFSTPLTEGGGAAPRDQGALLRHLQEVNRVFNSRRAIQPESPDRYAAEAVRKKSGSEEKDAEVNKERSGSFAEKYLDVTRSSKQKAALGQVEKRVEQISPQQAMNLAQREELQQAGRERARATPPAERREAAGGKADALDAAPPPEQSAQSALTGSSVFPPLSASVQPTMPLPSEDGLRAEVDPLQSVSIDENQVLLFRRVVIGNQVYRQGMVIRVEALLDYLEKTHFTGQPMARFTSLTLTSVHGGHETTRVRKSLPSSHPRFSLERSFPRPFSFVRATLTCEVIPRSPGRTTLYVMLAALAAVILVGLLAIYQSARVVTDLSERRSGFVSSVTHELKTPLTNIRMYIEMLEHGIASDPEREMEYYRILGSESARLSRLINNVLEFSKLEKKQRRLDLREGTLEDVLTEVRDAMQERLRQEGFTLTVENRLDRAFRYDREVMVQVLINLIDNGVKFGKGAPEREISVRVRPEGDRVAIRVSDTGPGIPRHALKKIFDDFYRVDNDLTRTTKGTGIGLALVKRFVEAMGGRVFAANNEGPGCTITISLPWTPPSPPPGS
ncbi:MAG: sensor histidine kinase [Syntrophobacteraceae bacterium]